MLNFAVAGVPAGIVIGVLVEALKRIFKLQGDIAIAIAVAVGVAVSVVAQVARVYPAFGVWWETAIAGILLGLAACGLFDLGQALKAKLQ
jgi:ABC-type Mn2+/Zn2+ transport system permease subunit